MSKMQTETLRIFMADMRHAKKIKSMVIKIAQEEPMPVLEALKGLPEEDQKYLRWLKLVAEKNLSA